MSNKKLSSLYCKSNSWNVDLLRKFKFWEAGCLSNYIPKYKYIIMYINQDKQLECRFVNATTQYPTFKFISDEDLEKLLKDEIEEPTKTIKTMKVEVTLQFEVPEDSDLEYVAELLRTRIKDFNYKEELVKTIYITKPERSILAKDARLEHLERSVSAFKELLLPEIDRSTEASMLLEQHHQLARETYAK